MSKLFSGPDDIKVTPKRKVVSVKHPIKDVGEWIKDFLNNRELYTKYHILLKNKRTNKRINLRKDSYKDLMMNLDYKTAISDIIKKGEELDKKPIKGSHTKEVHDRQKRELKHLFKYTLNSLNHYQNNVFEIIKEKNLKEIMKEREAYKELRPEFYTNLNKRSLYNNQKRNYSLNRITEGELLNSNIKKLSVLVPMKKLQNKFNNYKFKLVLNYTLSEKDENGNVKFSEDQFYSPKQTIIRPSDNDGDLYFKFLQEYNKCKEMLIKKFRDTKTKLESIDSLELDATDINDLQGSSYFEYNGKNKRSIINPHNEDNKCFYWAVCIGLIKLSTDKYIKDLQRISKIKKMMKELKINIDDTMIKDYYPIQPKEHNKLIKEFEIKNNIQLNIYCNNGENDTFLLYKSDNLYSKMINIMLLINKENGVNHYVYIENLGAIVQNGKIENKKVMCRECNCNILMKNIETHYKTHHYNYIVSKRYFNRKKKKH